MTKHELAQVIYGRPIPKEELAQRKKAYLSKHSARLAKRMLTKPKG